MERVIGNIGDAEVWFVVAETLVIESAREAGLQVAKSLEPDGGRLVVFDRSDADGRAAVRKVAVWMVEAGATGMPIPGVGAAGELAAIVEWDEAAGPGTVKLVRSDEWGAGAVADVAGLPAASPARWQALLVGSGVAPGGG